MIVQRHRKLPGSGVALAADVWEPASRAGVTPAGTVLLLHGGGQTRHSWQATAQLVAQHGWNAVTIDARGHGDSEWSPDGDYSLDTLGADLDRVIDDLVVEPVIVGASMGGMTALIALGEGRVTARGLVLVDVTPRIESEGAARIQSFMSTGTAGFDDLDEVLAAVTAYNPHRLRSPRPDGLLKNLRERDGRLYWHWDPRLLGAHDALNEGSLGSEANYARARAAAASISIPTLLVRGRDSNVVSEDGARELLELIVGARMIEVEGAGHMVAGDDNSVFGAGLVDFLNREVQPISGPR